MKTLLIFIFCCAAWFLNAQEAPTIPLSQRQTLPLQKFTLTTQEFSASALDSAFTKYEVFAMPVEEVSHFAASQAGSFDLILQFSLEPAITLHLASVRLWDENAKCRVASEKGTQTFSMPHPATYQGFLNGERQYSVACSFAPEFCSGMMEIADGTTYWEPLFRFIPGAPQHLIVRYSAADVKHIGGLRCAVDDKMKIEQQITPSGVEQETSVTGCYELELAQAADWSIWQKYGGMNGTTAYLASIINLVRTNYDNEFNNTINFKIAGLWLSSCSTCDPWTTSTDPTTLLESFRDWAIAANSPFAQIPHDLGELWTNRSMNGFVGWAWIGSVCWNDFKYHWIQDYSTNAQQIRATVSHELGHNLNCSHDPGGTDIMNPSSNGSNTWSTASTNTINAYVQSKIDDGCLIACQALPATECLAIQTSATTEQLNSTFFTNNSTGWIVGVGGKIQKTVNGGVTWVTQTSPVTVILNKVFFIDAQTGWIAGNGGTILKTVNGGTIWTKQTLPNTEDYLAVHFSDNQNGWAVGRLGKMIRTTNGGSTWSAQTIVTSNFLWEVYFIDSQTGWAVGAGNTIIKTTNAGNSWTIQNFTPASTILYDASFVSTQTGWAVGSGGKILKTIDGGTTWTTQTPPANKDFYSVHFTDTQNGWAVGLNGVIIRTVDGGNTWTNFNFTTTNTLRGVFFPDAQNGWLVGWPGYILKFANHSAITNTVPTCVGLSSGSATVTASGGAPPYTYAWSNGKTTATIVNLAAGSYTVTVTAAGGCTTTAVATIGSLPAGIDCGLVAQYKFDNTLIDASGNNNNGTAPNGIAYTEDKFGNCKQAGLFNGTNAYVSVPSSSSLNSPMTVITLAGWAKSESASSGLYSIICKGIIGTNTIQYRLGVTSDKKMYFSYPTGSQTFSDILQSLGSFDIQTWNHYAVTWDGINVRFYLNGTKIGNDVPLSTTIQAITTASLELGRDAPGLGNEHVKGALDELRIYNRALSASEIQQLFTVTGDAPISATIATPTPVCSGISNGSATVTGAGGTTPYTYQWSNNQTTATATNLAVGTYTVTVTSSNGCSTTATATVGTAAAPTASASATLACAGLTNGFATVTGTGGTTPYTYQWSNNQATASATNLAVGTYTVTVTGNNGCSATATATVGTAVAPTASTAATLACSGISNGSATVTGAGGTTPYTYQWSNNQTTATATNLAAGTYTVTVTGNNGCVATATATVGIAPAPTATITSTVDACAGQSNGFVGISATGGNDLTYLWSNGQSGSMIGDLTADNYAVTVTNSNGCTTTATITIGTLPATTADFTFALNGQSVNFANTSTNATAYAWDFGNGDSASEANPSANLSAGVHQVCLIAIGVCGNDTICQSVVINPPGWNPECNTGIVHNALLLDTAISNIAGQSLAVGDLVGFFYTDLNGENVCNSVGVWTGATLAMSLCGDNPATSNIKEGYTPGENFLIRVWKDNTEYNVVACYLPKDSYGANNPNATGSFAPFGLSYIECLKTPSDPGASLGCNGPIPIACGETKTGNTSNGTAAAISYNCFYNLVDGPEVVYKFINPVAQNVLIKLKDLHEDLELLLLNACDRNSCVLFSDRTGSIPEAILAENLAAGTYFIIIDGYLGSDSPYTLHIECGSNATSNGTLDCSSAIAAQCGQPITGNTNTGSDQIVQYGCSATYNSGKEKIYSLTLPENKAVSARLFGMTADLNLMALNTCDPAACFASSSLSGTQDEAVLFYATAGKTYYFVVDGYFDAESPYSLSFFCYDPCTDCPNNDYDLNGPGGPGTGPTVCEEAQVLQCGVPISGNNSTGHAYADSYTCPSSYTIGKEVVYKFTITETQDVTLILSGMSANLDLYLLDACSVLSCHAASHKIGNSDEGMVLQALAAGTYYVVVDGNNNALSGYSLIVNCTNSALTCQKINLVAGTNFVSSNIIPNDPAIDRVFQQQPNIISVENQGNVGYSPSAGTDPAVFGNWDYRKAYRIKALMATSFEVCGQKADPETPIPFIAKTPQGQAVNNWSAYLSDVPALVGEEFTPLLTPNIFRVWNMPTGPTGTLQPQAWVVTAGAGTAFNLQAGRGYILNATLDGAYSAGFASGEVADRSSQNRLPLVVENGCQYFQTPYYNSLKAATILLPKAILAQKLAFDDEIGVFRQDGSLLGSGRYNGFALSLVVSGDEAATADFSEGFVGGETMIFRLWKSNQSRIFDLQATFQTGSEKFENEGVNIVSGLEILEASIMQVPKAKTEWAVYPNPAHETLWIDLLLPQAAKVCLELLSTNGQLLHHLANQEMPAGRTVFQTETSGIAPGIYLLKMTTGQSVSFKKIIISQN